MHPPRLPVVLTEEAAVSRRVPVHVILKDSRTGRTIEFTTDLAIITKKMRFAEEKLTSNILAWETPTHEELTVETDFSKLAEQMQPREIEQRRQIGDH